LKLTFATCKPLVEPGLKVVAQLTLSASTGPRYRNLVVDREVYLLHSMAMTMFLESFKTAAAEGAVVELKLRLLAGKIPALQQYAHQKTKEDIENEVVRHFDGALSVEEKENLRLCRQLRNKVLHSDFHAARGKLNELGVETPSWDVKKIDIPVVSITEVSKKVRDAREGVQGTFQYVADTSSTGSGGVYGWFLEAGQAGDFQKASNAFKNAAAIIDRLAEIAKAAP
jgi:hypothetical protein